MRTVGVGELVNHLGRSLRCVRNGETVVVLRRGEYAAFLESPILSSSDRLRQLEHLGVIRPPRRRLTPVALRMITGERRPRRQPNRAQKELFRMKNVSVTELKNRLSHYLRLVKRGETVQILERSIPVASLHGPADPTGSKDAQIQRLIREGIATPPKTKPYRGFLRRPPLPCRVDPVKVLLEQRGDR